jgi:hypothetical protein
MYVKSLKLKHKYKHAKIRDAKFEEVKFWKVAKSLAKQSSKIKSSRKHYSIKLSVAGRVYAKISWIAQSHCSG